MLDLPLFWNIETDSFFVFHFVLYLAIFRTFDFSKNRKKIWSFSKKRKFFEKNQKLHKLTFFCHILPSRVDSYWFLFYKAFPNGVKNTPETRSSEPADLVKYTI